MPHSWSLHALEYKLHVAENEPESVPLASGVASTCVGPRFLKCFVAMDDKTHEQIMERKYEVAVKKWLTTVSFRLLASKTGLAMQRLRARLHQVSSVQPLALNLLRRRSSMPTLCWDIYIYVFFMAKFRNAHPFPFSEERVWSYHRWREELLRVGGAGLCFTFHFRSSALVYPLCVGCFVCCFVWAGFGFCLSVLPLNGIHVCIILQGEDSCSVTCSVFMCCLGSCRSCSLRGLYNTRCLYFTAFTGLSGLSVQHQ